MNSSFVTTGSAKKDQFLEDAKLARLERLKEKETQEAVIKIQSTVRGFVIRSKIRKEIIAGLDQFIPETLEKDASKQTISTEDAFNIVRQFFLYFQPKNDRNHFDGICRYILSSILTPSSSTSSSYITVASNPKLTLSWIQQIKKILHLCSSFLRELRPEINGDHKSMMLYLNMILTLTNPQVWKLSPEGRAAMTIVSAKMMHDLVSKGLLLSLQALLKKGLCSSRICLNKTQLLAIVTISLRPVITMKNDTQINLFLLQIFSVPGLTFHIQSMAPETVLNNSLPIKDVAAFLEKENNFTIIFNALEGNYGLCLLANLIHWACMDEKNLVSNLALLVKIIQSFLDRCQQYVVTKQSSSSHWHPILGWFSQREDSSLHDSLSYVRKQLSRLWDVDITTAVFTPLLLYNQQHKPKSSTSNQRDGPSVSLSKSETSLSRLKRVIDRASLAISSSDTLVITGNPESIKHLLTPEVTLISSLCSMYASALSTMTQIRLEILTGLCYNEALIKDLWLFISNLDDRSGLITFLELISLNPKATEIQVLTLFCECATHLIT